MSNQRSPDTILHDIAAIGAMERGKLSEFRRTGGKVYYNLQFWTDGRNRCEYVPARDVEGVRQALANYALYQQLVEEYAGVVEYNTRQNRRQSAGPEKKGSANRPRRQQPGR